MSIEKELREELRQAANSMHCPPDLSERVRRSYQKYVHEKRGRSDGVSQEDYQEIEGMLQTAKGKLTEVEFKEYTELTKQLVQLKLKITDEKGVVHEEKLTKEEQQQFEQLASRLAPYFAKINGTAKP